MLVTRLRRRTSEWLLGDPRLFYREGWREEVEEMIGFGTEVLAATG